MLRNISLRFLSGSSDKTGTTEQDDIPEGPCDVAGSSSATFNANLHKIANDTPAAAAAALPTVKRFPTFSNGSDYPSDFSNKKRQELELAFKLSTPASRAPSPPTVRVSRAPSPPTVIPEAVDVLREAQHAIQSPSTLCPMQHENCRYFQDVEYIRQATEREFLRQLGVGWQEQPFYHQDPSMSCTHPYHHLQWCQEQQFQHPMMLLPPPHAQMVPDMSAGMHFFPHHQSLANEWAFATAQSYIPDVAPEARMSYIELAKDKDGSQLLQQQLQFMPADKLDEVIRALTPKLFELTTHKYGNYLVSALVERTASIHRHLATVIKGRVARLMQHTQGCRVVQCALEHLPTSKARSLVGELRGKVAQVARNKEGKYSILVALKCTREPWMVKEVAESLSSLSTSRNGSLFLQRLLDPKRELLPQPLHGPGSYGSDGLEGLHHACDVAPVLDALVRMGSEKLAALASDEYANFVVKLGLLLATHREALVGALLPQLEALSVTKWGSHVAKAVVCVASPKQLAEAQAALAAVPSLRGHAYASFVMVALERACTSKSAAKQTTDHLVFR